MMQKKLFCLMLFLFGLYFNTAHCQNAIKEKVQAHSQQIESAQSFQLFNEITNSNLNDRVPNTVLSEKQFLDLKKPVLQSIRNNQPELFRLSLNIEGQSSTLNLFKADVVTPDFQVVDFSKEPIEVNSGLHYWGTVEDDPNSLVSISIFKNEIVGLIVLTNGSYTLGKVKDENTHILYKTANLNTPENYECGVVGGSYNIGSVSNSINANSVANNCVKIQVEVDYQLYLDFGSDGNAVANYVVGLFSQVALLYANESINLVVNYINIWTQPSPYTAGNELSDLTNQGYGTANGDLVHLLHRNSLSGLGWVNSLCYPPYNTSEAGVFATYNNVPTYSSDVGLVTHEIGHNLGSEHTHGCYWNGNNTAIDGCGPFIGYNEGCNAPLPAAGTIMSYCNLVSGVGIDFSLGFGPQPGDLIRNNYNNAPCLSSCSNCSDYPLTFNFDENPEELTWEIISDVTGQMVASGGGYSNGLASSSITENLCLEDGCYTLIVNDSGNNGACPTAASNFTFGSSSTGLTGIGNIIYTNYLYVTSTLCRSLVITDEFGTPVISEFGDFGAEATGGFCNSANGLGEKVATNSDVLDHKINMSLYPTISKDVVMILFTTQYETSIDLNIYNATGNLMKSIKNQNIQNGQTMQLDINDLPNGSYFIRMSSYKHTKTQRFFKF